MNEAHGWRHDGNSLTFWLRHSMMLMYSSPVVWFKKLNYKLVENPRTFQDSRQCIIDLNTSWHCSRSFSDMFLNSRQNLIGLKGHDLCCYKAPDLIGCELINCCIRPQPIRPQP